ncbi:CPBP family glutamic-type intramembrane protease [Paenirhodobacter populi]|uniref:CPBP family intramembrane metalloprotease n=1 Tax=Paenirhodobacter populi TaxID=2306993 RepID=A0A443J536_9RHOB|nr:CPBP family glutamic-type intramembrane protease [Sinirhodobacter populi]RWR15423.1 CPBP family intramembrane metalloprotease [Sinirhodobacter populi]
MTGTPDPNSRTALQDRRARHLLVWSGPLLFLFARPAFAVVAQGLVAAICAARGSASAWRDAGAWFSVYGTLIDAGCLALLWWLTRKEGLSLRDLIGFERRKLGRDILLGLALIPPGLLFILGGIAASSLLIFGRVEGPQLSEPLPFIAALYAVLVWPLIWGFTEQMGYNGYLVPRLQVLAGRTWVAVAVVAFVWSFQHAVMPLSFDPAFMLHRALSSIPNALFMIVVYLRLRRLLPLAIAHWLMDGASTLSAF